MNEAVTPFRSALLGNERPIWVVEPADVSRPTRLVMFLDAEFYRDRIGARETIQQLGRARANTWFVFVSMHQVESRWSELPCNPRFADMVVTELLPWLAVHFPGIDKVSERVLVGVSYSGLAAAFIARQHPGVFQKVIAQSGSFWSADCRLVEEFRGMSQPLPAAFYLEAGTRETQVNVEHRPGHFQKISQLEGVRRFRDALIASGHVVSYVEFEGAHESPAWQKALPSALQWALGIPSR